MKKIFLKVFFLTAAILGLWVISASADTYGCYKYLVENGEVTITGVTSSGSFSGAQTIPGEISGYPVTGIGYKAFSDCDSLTSITIPDNVTSIGRSAFGFCKNLTSITIPDSVTGIGEYAFYSCTSLTSITISDSVTSINDFTFARCRSVKSITIPDSVKTIGDRAFSECINLRNITIPDGVTSINQKAFYDTAYYDNSSNWEYGILYIGKHLINTKTGLSGDYSIKAGTKTISNSAFSDRDSLTSITIPDSVTSIGENAFWSCNSLTDIKVDENNNTFSSLDGVLYNKDKSLIIAYPAGKTNNSFVIPDTVTNIGNDAFCDCKNLTGIIIPGGVTSMGDSAFRLCSNLTSIIIPGSVTSIGDFAFSECTGLTSITLPDSITSIGDSAFLGCKSLTRIIIPDSVASIGKNAFFYCTGLTSIIIPGGVTSIGDYAFSGCKNLTSVIIPDSVTDIGDSAFSGCKIYYLETKEQWNEINGISQNSLNTVHYSSKLIKYTGDYTGEEYVGCNENAKLPEPPAGYKYIFTVNGEVWNGENITENVTVTVVKEIEIYTVTYTGDYEGTEQVKYRENANLPEPPIGYKYIFTVNSEVWNGENITENVTVTVVKENLTYTVTYTGDYEGTEQLKYPENANLPEPPAGYKYIFTVNGELWNGENITENVTVTVVKEKEIYTVTYTGDYSGTESVKYREYAQIPTQLAAPYGYRYVFRESGFVSEWDGYVTGDVTVKVTKTGTLAELDTDYFGEHSALSRIAVSGNKIYGEYYNVLYENTDKALLAKYNGTVVLYADEACTKLLEKDPLFDEYIFGFTKTGESKTYYAQIISEDGINSKVYEIEICFNIAEQLGSIRVSAKGSTITVRYDPSKLKGDPSISVYCKKSNGTSAESILASEGDERFAINRERAIITVSGLRQETEYDVTLIADYGIKNATTFPIESIPTKVITGKDLSKECILTGIADLFSNVVQGATEEDWGEITTANLENSFFEYQIYANVSIGATWELYSSMELKASQIISDKKLALKAGEKNLAYIKVTSEDGEHSRKYKLIIYRQTKAPAPSIAVKDGYAQIYCADGTVAYYTTDKSDPSEINIGVNTKVYESAFAVKDGMLIKAISVDPEHKKYDEESDITKYTVGSSAEEQTYINLKLSDKGSSSFAFSLSSPNVIHGFLVLALYDENGNLADVKIKEVTGASEKINNVNCQNAKSYKAFVVDKLSNLKPISNSVSGAVN